MRYTKITYGTGYCGMDGEEYLAFSDKTSDSQIEEYAYECMYDNAESYCNYERWGLLESRECYETEEEYAEAYAEAEQDWKEGCWYAWEEVTKEEWEDNYGEVV